MVSMMKERFSNVLAWVGMAYPLVVLLTALAGFKDFSRLLLPPFDYTSNVKVFTFLLAVYFGSSVINYLSVGRIRLLPWK